jgi:predicted nucleic acid-binding protein
MCLHAKVRSIYIALRTQALTSFAEQQCRVHFSYDGCEGMSGCEDDKFLEVALDGAADLILTGDKDLLSLNPFHRIPILSPADYLLR